MNNKRNIIIGMVVMAMAALAATPQVKNVKAVQRWPWNHIVDISYEVIGEVWDVHHGPKPFLHVIMEDQASGKQYETTTITCGEGELKGDTDINMGFHKITWDLSKQRIAVYSTNVIFSVRYDDERYMVVDLSAGTSYPVSYLWQKPSGGWSDDYKTTKIVLRLIPEKGLYVGIFEVTRNQSYLVCGRWGYGTDSMMPITSLSWDDIRGDSTIYDWPSVKTVAANSFIGLLRSKTGLNFDLPTVAQWEYVCRAGTTSKFNNGGNSTSDLDQLGLYSGNRKNYGDGRTAITVGLFVPNFWGFYDMHGNVWEWCLDAMGTNRVVCGGSCWESANNCTSSSRQGVAPNTSDGHYVYDHVYGFRIVCEVTK